MLMATREFVAIYKMARGATQHSSHGKTLFYKAELLA
jgi:hypothetical protein